MKTLQERIDDAFYKAQEWIELAEDIRNGSMDETLRIVGISPEQREARAKRYDKKAYQCSYYARRLLRQS